MIEIKSRCCCEVICSGETVREAVESAARVGVSLRYANLSSVDPFQVNLCGADLAYANLSGSDFGLANLRGASIMCANVEGTSF